MSKISKNYLFRDPSLWLGRLQNIIIAIEETIDQTDMQIQVREKVSDASGMFKFQLLQIKSLKSMLENMQAFAETILSECTAAVLTTNNDKNPKLGLLRAAFHELTTDLNLVQRALNQRLWAINLSVPEKKNAKSSNKTNSQLAELLKTSLRTQLGLEDDEWAPGEGILEKAWGRVEPYLYNVFEHAPINSISSLVDSVLDTEVRSKQTQTLIYADILANHALAPAQGLINHTSKQNSIEVVTYFTENNVSIRILPYYPDIILVGLPYSTGFLGSTELGNFTDLLEEGAKTGLQPSAQFPWEFLSLPHEIGHYLFWNGVITVNGQEVEIDWHLRHQLMAKLKLAKTDWRYHWLEELFADTFKCLLMGPVAVLGLQVLLSDAADYDNLFHNNGYHPIPAVRPLIASRIVAKLYPGRFTNALAQLDTNWKSLLALWGFNADTDNISIGGKGSGEVKGQWTNHMHRDQPGEAPEWGKAVELLFSQLEADLNSVIDEIVAVLEDVKKQLETQKSATADSLLAKLSGAETGPLFPWEEDLAADEDVGALINKVLVHLKPRLTDFNVKDVAFSKTAYDYEAILKSLGPNLVQALQTEFISNWGDKGPRGGSVSG